MKLTHIGFLTAAAATIMTTNANAATIYDVYGGLTLGAGAATVFADHDNETSASQTFGAMFGIDLPVFRAEIEYNYLNQTDFHANMAMANAYFKMASTVVKPYMGLGVGMMFGGKYDLDVDDADIKTTPAYQGMLGVTIDTLTLPFKFDIEGRVTYAPDAFKVADVEPDILNYEGRIKLRYIF